ncbi:MAG: formimidoylglutamate deiminase [Alphaproteobacteria bacterium]|nr:formimidoylglutamate deiminase [Alphaproteobacteria bacterium]MBU0799240.1 formimidoylglutamate deiminase [Alphaproteobacteria bacterium]MBU0887622.1 formimidoylglutamate deiminase [Alphaproteobacteria bacterium]MBU1812951.1 formimidoylglutamate deiminase [Alphaproteobacteria bacterium]
MRRLIFDHALLPDGWADRVALTISDGWIETVEPNADGPGERIAGIALPGMPDLHSHAFQRGMAGLAETRGPASDSFWTWRQVMYRFLERLTPETVEAVSAFAMMEMVEGGFTALAEFHYLHHDSAGQPYADRAELSARIAAAAAASGIGLTLLPVFYAHSGFGGLPPTDGQRRFVNDIDGFARLLEGAAKAIAPLPDSRLGVAPHSLRAVTTEEITALVGMVPDGPIHIHIAEQMQEVEDCLAWSGRRPVEWLMDSQKVDERWCLVHATHLLPAETTAMAVSGAVAGLCPLTEANLGDGIFDGVNYLAQGGHYGIGSDSNIELDAAGELKMLEYSQRLRDRGRNLLAPAEGASTGRALYTAALAGGSQALGRKIGALEAGYRADIVVLDGEHPDLATAKGDRWLDAYIFVAGKAAIDTVIIGGEVLVEGGRHRARDTLAARYRAALASVKA